MFFGNRVSLDNPSCPGCPRTHRDLPSSASQVLDFEVFATTHRCIAQFKEIILSLRFWHVLPKFTKSSVSWDNFTYCYAFSKIIKTNL